MIDLLTDGRKNESMQNENRILPVCLFLLSLLCIGISAALFNKNGVLPSHENNLFQLAAAALVAGTFLLFYSLSAVFMQVASARKCFYLKGLNTFLVRQIGSKIRTNYLVVTVVCGLLTITICAVSIGASTALLELGDGEIGDLMGMSRSAVQRHRTKTLNELQKKLKAHLPEGG